jgi:hypothetical protein
VFAPSQRSASRLKLVAAAVAKPRLTVSSCIDTVEAIYLSLFGPMIQQPPGGQRYDHGQPEQVADGEAESHKLRLLERFALGVNVSSKPTGQKGKQPRPNAVAD